MKVKCSTCGRDTLCEDCAWDAYCDAWPPHINISSGEDACSNEVANSYQQRKGSNVLLLSPPEKGKKSHTDSTVIVKPTRSNEVLHEE